MFDRPWDKPPLHPEKQATADGICELLGVPEKIQGIPSYPYYVYPCALEVCVDRELYFRHPQNFSEAKLIELFGRQNYNEGSFQPALRAMIEESPPAWQRGLEDFQKKVAYSLVSNLLHVKQFSIYGPSVRLARDTLLFDQHSVELPPLQRPRVVVDYGPGINSRFMLQEHVEALQQGRPFTYVPIAKGCFINFFMGIFLSMLMTPEASENYMRRRFLFSSEAGILTASSNMARTSPGAADLVLCSGLQDVEKQALRAGIENAFTILRPDGILMVRSQRIRDPESSSTVDDMLEIAYQAGFSAKSARFFHSMAGLNNHMPTMTALLRKS